MQEHFRVKISICFPEVNRHQHTHAVDFTILFPFRLCRRFFLFFSCCLWHVSGQRLSLPMSDTDAFFFSLAGMGGRAAPLFAGSPVRIHDFFCRDINCTPTFCTIVTGAAHIRWHKEGGHTVYMIPPKAQSSENYVAVFMHPSVARSGSLNEACFEGGRIGKQLRRHVPATKPQPRPPGKATVARHEYDWVLRPDRVFFGLGHSIIKMMLPVLANNRPRRRWHYQVL